jgi:cob(I)alamin adenosyltransferase
LPENEFLRGIQNELFDVGADLCAPLPAKGQADQRLRIQTSQAERLEKEIDRLNESLQPLTSFVLPGGSIGAAWCHLARTVCRRAERAVVVLSHTEPVNPQVIIYLNRLSDLLFVLARVLNGNGSLDVLWVPGKTRESNQGPERQRRAE